MKNYMKFVGIVSMVVLVSPVIALGGVWVLVRDAFQYGADFVDGWFE